MKKNAEDIYAIFQQYPAISIDSRKIEKNSLFFALKGEHFNGNQFAEQALLAGASYAVIDDKKYALNEKCLLVEDVLQTLQNIARIHRKQSNAKVIGITGSNGKTTTKELITRVLSRKYHCIATVGNLNNHIGVPLTLLSAKASTQLMIIEMGANHLGEIKLLCDIAKPHFGLITNIGRAHLEGFGSYENVIRAKGELYDFLRNTKGLVFYNEDDKLLKRLSRDIQRISYGKSKDADCQATPGLMNENMQLVIHLKQDDTFHKISSQLTGAYNFDNIMAAISAGKYWGVELEDIIHIIEEYKPENMRSQIIETNRNTLFLDAYNANPSSMEQALRNFANIKKNSKIVILGEMAELGEYAKDEHHKIFKLTQQLKFNIAYFIGPHFMALQSENQGNFFLTTEDFKTYLKTNPIRNAKILLKGSRVNALEKLVENL